MTEPSVIRFQEASEQSRRTEIRRDLEAHARTVADRFVRSQNSSVPLPAVEREANLAVRETMDQGIDRPRESLRCALEAIYQTRLSAFWQTIQPGIPQFWSNTDRILGWQSGFLRSIARHQQVAPADFGTGPIPVYDVRPEGDWTATLLTEQPVAWCRRPLIVTNPASTYAIRIPAALATAARPLGKLIVLDATLPDDWRPPSAGTAVVVSMWVIGHDDRIISWFGHLDEMSSTDVIVRQSDEAICLSQIERKAIVIHRILGFAE